MTGYYKVMGNVGAMRDEYSHQSPADPPPVLLDGPGGADNRDIVQWIYPYANDESRKSALVSAQRKASYAALRDPQSRLVEWIPRREGFSFGVFLPVSKLALVS